MSRSQYVGYRDEGFWVYDVVSSVFLSFLVEAADEQVATNSWLSEDVYSWRVNAIVSDYSFHLNNEWSRSQIDLVVALCRQANEAIRSRASIPASDIPEPFPNEWIELRGHNPIPSEPVARFGEAIISLLRGELPEAPQGHWWFYTLESDVDLIAKQQSD